MFLQLNSKIFELTINNFHFTFTILITLMESTFAMVFEFLSRKHLKIEISKEVLGTRIMILGPMASGKSTLAEMTGKKLGFPVYHLDQCCLLPNTYWERRPIEESKRLHDQAVNADKWVIEGNYLEFMPFRVSRATSVIWLNPSTLKCIFNFYKRFFRKNRKGTPYAGMLENARERFTIKSVKYILRHKEKKSMFEKALEIFPREKIFYLNSFKKVREFCEKIELL
ncbi:MAG: hypothetical protein LBQ23_00780 [Puniceicoccales bacterium]|jgi:adenylate kinase family enzyme|nr:hypothetical protein [Puniceicoccales bacterium]